MKAISVFSLFPIVAITALLSGCSSNAPECPSSDPAIEVRSAGCVVINDSRLLVIREMSGKISIPGGSGDSGESGRCTAFRETWEETGLAVEPKALIRNFDNGFHLYRCELMNGSSVPDPEFILEVQESFWLDSASFDEHSWRFPDQKDWLKAYLNDQ